MRSGRIAALGAAAARRLGLLVPPRDVGDLRPAHFRAAADADFLVRHEGGDLALRLRQVDVKPYPGGDGRPQFSVVLHGAGPAPHLSQQCRVEHPWLGAHQLFVNRVAPQRADDPPTYEICFS